MCRHSQSIQVNPHIFQDTSANYLTVETEYIMVETSTQVKMNFEMQYWIVTKISIYSRYLKLHSDNGWLSFESPRGYKRGHRRLLQPTCLIMHLYPGKSRRVPWGVSSMNYGCSSYMFEISGYYSAGLLFWRCRPPPLSVFSIHNYSRKIKKKQIENLVHLQLLTT